MELSREWTISSLDCRTWKQDQPYITDAGVLNVKAKVEHPNHETVTIVQNAKLNTHKTNNIFKLNKKTMQRKD